MKGRKIACTVIMFQAVFVLKIKVRAEIHLYVFACHLANNLNKQRLNLKSRDKFRSITSLSVVT